MAMVSLSSYLHGPMGGFHEDIPCKVTVEEPKGRPYPEDIKKELLSLSDNPTLGEFNEKVPSMSNSFEWVFKDGFLALGNLFQVKGEIKWIYFVKLDVREWLQNLLFNNPWHLIGLICMSSWDWNPGDKMEGVLYRNGGYISKSRAENFCKSVGLS